MSPATAAATVTARGVAKTGVAFSRLWHLVDAKGQVLGKMSRGIASVLAGEYKPIYEPSRKLSADVRSIHACTYACDQTLMM